MAIIFIRSLIVYAAILVALRIMGKRQLGELEISELVVAVLISDMAVHPLQDIGIPLVNGLIPILVLLSGELIISGCTLRSMRLRKLIWGKPSILIEKGKLQQKELRRNRISLDELTESLRKKDILDISRIHYAILETDGTLNTVLYESESGVTAKQLQIETKERGLPVAVISDGRVIKENIGIIGKNEEWLKGELERRGIARTEEVYYMSCDEADGIYISVKE